MCTFKPRFHVIVHAISKTLKLNNQVAVYSHGSQLEWREVEGGQLPQPSAGLRATLVGDILFVTGGLDDGKELTSILAWDPVAECWQPAGDLVASRDLHAAVALPASNIAMFCKH